jgi:predicted ATP-grasp superfamily ATP-dependent carboligase
LKQQTAPVLIIAAGSNISSLAVAGCFRGTGVPLIAVDTDGGARLLRGSPDIGEVIAIANPVLEPQRALEQLLELGERLGRKWGRRLLLLPTEDTGLGLCADGQARLSEHFIIPGDKDERDLNRFLDKGRFFAQLPGEEPYVPWSRFCRDEDALLELEGVMPFPAVAKPARKSAGPSFQRWFGAKLVAARTFAELRESFRGCFPAEGLLVQEQIEFKEGDEVCWWGFRDRQGGIIGLTARELRKFPLIGGTATYMRTEAVPELHEYARRILDRTGFWGLCELPFLPAAGGFKVLECNPRPWLQIGLAARAGLNLPLKVYNDVEIRWGGSPVADNSAEEARPEVYWMSPEYDLIRCFFSGRSSGPPVTLRSWIGQVRRADDIGLWNLETPRLVLERLLSYPSKLWKNRMYIRRR